jgi:methionyl-tRNA formyltransferase
MANPVKPLIFFGSDDFSLAALEALYQAGWPIEAVVTKPDSTAGRGRKLTSPVTKVWAEEHSIPVLQPEKLSDAEPKLNNFRVQLGVVASYGKIIPDSVFDLFPLGLINVHPSLLPKYRGPSPIEAAILNGDSQSGVSIMLLNPEMDAGPIFAQINLPLSGKETQPELYDQLGKRGAELLIDVLPAIVSEELKPQPQDENLVSFTKLIQKSDGQIDWSQPAEQIEREIRAYLGWPGSRTQLFEKDVTITAAHVESENEVCPPGKCLHMSTGQGCLVIDKLKPAGGREMTAAEFLAGIRN